MKTHLIRFCCMVHCPILQEISTFTETWWTQQFASRFVVFLTISRRVDLLMTLLQSSHSNHHYQKNIFLEITFREMKTHLIRFCCRAIAQFYKKINIYINTETRWAQKLAIGFIVFLNIGRTVVLLRLLLQNSHSNHHHQTNMFLKNFQRNEDTLDQILLQGALPNFTKKSAFTETWWTQKLEIGFIVFLTISRTVDLLMLLLQNSHNNHPH